ncbi:MAG: hypothetical protein R3C05_21685 [Pirellulaceae bacterium]
MDNSPSSDADTRSKGSFPWLVLILPVLFILAIGGLLLYAASSVGGTEFAPTHFEKRTFAVLELPLVHIQLRPVDHTSTTDSTSRYLIANKLVDVPKTKASRWDLVSIGRLIPDSNQADASVLTAYLDGHGGNAIDWKQWSTKNPKAARVLWPFVQQMAMDNLYLLMPRVFELAENETDPIQLKNDLDAFLIDALPDFAEDLFNARYHQQALDALRSARDRYPGEQSIGEAYDRLKQKVADKPS